MFKPNPIELAWAAGFFDGEGSTVKTESRSLKMSITQAGDYALYSLSRFSQALGGRGHVNGPYQMKPGPNGKPRKPMYYLQITGFETVQASLGMLWAYLGPQKRMQALAALSRCRQECKLANENLKEVLIQEPKPVQKRRPRITKEISKQIYEARQAGMNLKSIQEKFGVSKVVAQRHSEGAGGRDVWCFNGHRRTTKNTRSYVRLRDGKEYSERVCLDCQKESRRKRETSTPLVASIQA